MRGRLGWEGAAGGRGGGPHTPRGVCHIDYACEIRKPLLSGPALAVISVGNTPHHSSSLYKVASAMARPGENVPKLLPAEGPRGVMQVRMAICS